MAVDCHQSMAVFGSPPKDDTLAAMMDAGDASQHRAESTGGTATPLGELKSDGGDVAVPDFKDVPMFDGAHGVAVPDFKDVPKSDGARDVAVPDFKDVPKPESARDVAVPDAADVPKFRGGHVIAVPDGTDVSKSDEESLAKIKADEDPLSKIVSDEEPLVKTKSDEEHLVKRRKSDTTPISKKRGAAAVAQAAEAGTGGTGDDRVAVDVKHARRVPPTDAAEKVEELVDQPAGSGDIQALDQVFYEKYLALSTVKAEEEDDDDEKVTIDESEPLDEKLEEAAKNEFKGLDTESAMGRRYKRNLLKDIAEQEKYAAAGRAKKLELIKLWTEKKYAAYKACQSKQPPRVNNSTPNRPHPDHLPTAPGLLPDRFPTTTIITTLGARTMATFRTYRSTSLRTDRSSLRRDVM